MKKSLYYLIAAMFIIPLSGLIPIRGTDVWYSQYLGFTAVLFFGISLYLWKWNKYISILTILALYSALFVCGQHPRALFMLVYLDVGCLSLKYISEQYKNRKPLLDALIWFIGLQCVWVIFQYFNLDPFFDNVNSVLPDDTVGISGSKNQLGLFMAVVIPIVIAKCIYILPFVIFALLCSKTSSAFVGAVIGTIYYLYVTKNKFRHYTLIGILLLSILFIFKFESYSKHEINNRFQLAKTTISQVENEKLTIVNKKKDIEITKIVTCNRWFGFGFGNFMRLSPFTQDYIWGAHIYRHTHNDYVEIWFELGRLGLISVLLILFNTAYRYFLFCDSDDVRMLFSSLLIFCITANGIFTMHTAVSLMLFILIFGLLIGGLNE